MIDVSLSLCAGPGGDGSRSPKGRTIPQRRDQGNAPQALALAFRLRAVSRPEAPKGRPTAACTIGEYTEKVEYIRLNRVRAGLVSRPEDWVWSSRSDCNAPQQVIISGL